MLSDFSKLETFLSVVREKSFSKASQKLNISQPAVTQQIKQIETYLDTKIVERKKNGIKLTREGNLLYDIALKLEKSIIAAKKDLQKIVNKDVSFIFGTSFVVGNYILPRFLNELKKIITKDVVIKVNTIKKIVENLYDKKIDIALIEQYVSNNNLVCKEWVDDEIVMFSNKPLPRAVTNEDLMSYKWVCRKKDSITRAIFKENLLKANLPDCDDFNLISEVASDTAIIQTILNANDDTQIASVVSRRAIESFLSEKKLYETTIGSQKMYKKLYIVYRKDNNNIELIDSICDFMLQRARKFSSLA